jgi:hypothetical protein
MDDIENKRTILQIKLEILIEIQFQKKINRVKQSLKTKLLVQSVSTIVVIPFSKVLIGEIISFYNVRHKHQK